MRRSTGRKKFFMSLMGLSSLLILASNYIDFSETNPRESRYSILDLGVGLYPNKINDSGTVVGIMVGNRMGTEAFVWREETGKSALTPESDSLSFANDISETGLVVGHIGKKDGESRAYSWMSLNTEFDFTPFDSGQSVAYAVNSYGHMAGQFGESAHSNYEAFRYDPEDGIRSLGTLGGNLSQASGLNDSGEVVGWSVTKDRNTRAFRWNEEHGMVDLGTLGGNRSLANAINRDGTIVGQSETAEGKTQAALFEENEVRRLPSLGGTWSLASDINEVGVIVGQAEAPRTALPAFAQRAFEIGSRFILSGFPRDKALAIVWEGNTPNDLNQLIPKEAGWDSLSAATGLNDKGQIVGFGRKNGHIHGFLLTPSEYEKTEDTLVVSINTDFLSAN